VWEDYCMFYLTRPYFHRVWIVQELLLAKSFEVMAGRDGRDLNWFSMLKLSTLLMSCGWYRPLEGLFGRYYPSGMPWAVDLVVVQLNYHNKELLGWSWAKYWLNTLQVARENGCSLPQDKVLATVGILQQVLPEGAPFTIRAAATPEEVFLSATKVLLLHGDLTVLSYADHPFSRRLTHLPSWVPDWSNVFSPKPLGIAEGGYSACILNSPSTSPLLNVSPAGEHKIRGLKLGIINTLPCGYGPREDGFADAVLRFLTSMLHLYPHKRTSTP
jgi:hypothetical protein